MGDAENQDRAVFRIALTEDEQRVVNRERDSDPLPHDGRYHPSFAQFRAAIEDVLDGVATTHAEKMASLMTLNFQEFDDVSFLAA